MLRGSAPASSAPGGTNPASRGAAGRLAARRSAPDRALGAGGAGLALEWVRGFAHEPGRIGPRCERLRIVTRGPIDAVRAIAIADGVI